MVVRIFLAQILRALSPIIINGIYGGFWTFRKRNISRISAGGIFRRLYFYYQERMGCYIGEKATIISSPILPHDMHGIFISNMSEIGENVVIFQHVTIGSNTLRKHPRSGAPVIGNNVYIGAGAKIIGHVHIGDNCRIGANCVVVKDMPPNTTAVAAHTRFIAFDHMLDNQFISADEFLKK